MHVLHTDSPHQDLLYLAEGINDTDSHAIANPCRCRRKYFSSLERLQIQQQSIEEPTSGRSSRASSSTTPFRPSLSLATRHRRRKSEKTVQQHDVSYAQVEFFLSLPEKVRKQQFSREEQHLFQGKCRQTLLPDDQDQDQESERAQQRFDDFQFDLPQTKKTADGDCTRGRSRRRSSSVSSAVSPTRLLYRDMLSTPVFTTRGAPKRDMRRTMSLTATPSRQPNLSLADGPLSPPLNMASQRSEHQRAHSSSLSGRRSSHYPAPPVFDPEAAHYQDPEARKKLRMYLASPQKFDEAIEFGFPSTAGSDVLAPHYQLPQISNHSRKFSRDMHTFLRHGKLSFFEDNGHENQGLDSDTDSVADVESPTTPSSTGLSFRLHSRQLSHRAFSLDSPNVSPIQNSHGQTNREMTLRMTLTRPDLRADEEQLYGWQSSPNTTRPVKDDPLALEDLVLTDDMTGTKGPFYVKPKARGSLVTRLLKRASLKTR